MKQPYYRIFIDNDSKREISEIVTNFKYEDSIDQDDVLELKVDAEFIENLDKDDEIITGTPLVFQFGYLGEEVSSLRRMRVTDIKYRYAQRVTATIVALDNGTKMKKNSSNQIWQGVTTREIVAEIATRYGLEVKMNEQGKIWESLPQGHLSDFEFIQQLAMKESNGNYIAYITGDRLYFERRGFDTESVITLIYGKGENIISFTPKQKESSVGASDGQVVGFDPETKKPVHSQSNNDTEKESISLGNYKNVYDEFADKIGVEKDGVIHQGTEKIFNAVSNLGTRVVTPSTSTKENSDVANSIKKKNDLKGAGATAVIEGNPLIGSNDIITIAGVFDRHKGNYLVNKITHTIDAGGYRSSLDIAKNGKYKVTSKRAESANTKVGEDRTSSKQTVTVNVYDENGELLTRITDDNYVAP